MKIRRNTSKKLTIYAVLLTYTLIALFPIWVAIINAFEPEGRYLTISWRCL